MRRAKPKTKREIKYNEKREVQAHKKPAQEEIDSIEIRMHLLNLATVVERHQSVWKREKEQKEDTIHSPSHYKIKGCKFESIHLLSNIIEELPGALAFYVGNAIKYLIRVEKKNGREDYEKAKVYLQWAIDYKFAGRGCSEDEIAGSLGTDWLTIISGICDGMSLKKGFTMNEIFKAIITCDYELALRYVDTLLTL